MLPGSPSLFAELWLQDCPATLAYTFPNLSASGWFLFFVMLVF